jgi:CRISPR-associated protein Cmr3
MEWLGLILRPLDTLFFRDGRPFAESTRAVSGLPNPQTLAGALRTALLTASGFNLQQFAAKMRGGMTLRQALEGAPKRIVSARFRGPWLALDANVDHGLSPTPLLPTPHSLLRGDGEKWYRADPLQRQLPGWAPPSNDMVPLWFKGSPDAKYPGGFLLPAGVKKVLAGGIPTNDDWRSPEKLYGFDSRTCISVDPDTLTAKDGFIYSTTMLTLEPGVCFYAEIRPGPEPDAPEDLRSLLPKTVPFGGEGRAVTPLPAEAFDWSDIQVTNGPRSSWLLVTPGVFGESGSGAFWKPDRIRDGKLKAAASGNPVAFSGWDIARGGPKPTRFAVPAGSIYFVENDVTIEDESLCTDAEDVAQGWGYALRGAWNHA